MLSLFRRRPSVIELTASYMEAMAPEKKLPYDPNDSMVRAKRMVRANRKAQREEEEQQERIAEEIARGLRQEPRPGDLTRDPVQFDFHISTAIATPDVASVVIHGPGAMTFVGSSKRNPHDPVVLGVGVHLAAARAFYAIAEHYYSLADQHAETGGVDLWR